MKTIFHDSFKPFTKDEYPYNWTVENTCEHPNKLGWVDQSGFALLYEGNKHIPLTAPVKDFELDLICHGDHFFSITEMLTYFRYNRKKQEGYCIKYRWGVCGKITHPSQDEVPQYSAALCRYYGQRSHNRYEVIGKCEIPGFCEDLTDEQRFRLVVKGEGMKFYHNERLVGTFSDQSESFREPGYLAFDRRGGNPALWFDMVQIRSEENVTEHVVIPERTIEFPSSVNGIVSPYYFSFTFLESAGRTILRTALTGGPSKKPVYPEIDRCRFNEKMFNPYIRLESDDGENIGKFYLFNGSIGLSKEHWNIAASIMLPADGECPVKRDFILDGTQKSYRCLIGYDKYIADDSICLAGGPTEAFVDDNGKVLFAGAPLIPGAVLIDVESPEDKLICSKIPKDIPFYDDALQFARNNHFFFEKEKISLKAVLRFRDAGISLEEFHVSITLENAFKEPIGNSRKYKFHPVNDAITQLTNVSVAKTKPFRISDLPVGVYHLHTVLNLGQRRIKDFRRTFEVMAEDPMKMPAPVASGLPKLFINILSGIKSEHFYPWGHATVDTAHYVTGGNNFFKVARDMRCWELLHLYGRKWLCWLKWYKTVFKENGLEPNRDLIQACNGVLTNIPRYDLWVPRNYGKPFIRNAFLEFLKSPAFIPVDQGCLTYDTVLNAGNQGLTLDQFKELISHNWKTWIRYFSDVFTRKTIPEAVAKIREINPQCPPFKFCPVYPTYAAVYKSGYFTFLSGRNLRGGMEKMLVGPNGFEDYPYSSRYAIARGIYQLASCKLEAPEMTIYPEMFGINGETSDIHVVYAHPPYGQSDPPPGFFIKQFYEYSYGVVWFDGDGFHYWKDHGYYSKTWDRENYDEMLYAYSFISRIKPVKPLRTAAFVFSLASCMAHPDHYESDEELANQGDVMNTAEESVAFAYEQSREDGQMAGFVVRMENLDALNPADVDLLVLPPMCGVPAQELAAIRKLHEHGVNLMGFEDVSGLEDLFGVQPVEDEFQITDISVQSSQILSKLKDLTEQTSHPLCRSRYKMGNSEVLLKGNDELPILVSKQTAWGRTAFYTIPPTVIRRSKARITTFGQESISELINGATKLVLHYLRESQIETTAGKILAFMDDQNSIHVIVEEDAWPLPGFPIDPLITIKLPNLKPSSISSDKEFSIVSSDPDQIKLRLHLAEHESARIRIVAHPVQT